jgi:hypothetical protein
MLKKALLSTLVLLAGCDHCVENAVRVLGKDALCRHADSNQVVCYSQARQKGFVCTSDGEPQGVTICVEGLAQQPEAPR